MSDIFEKGKWVGNTDDPIPEPLNVELKIALDRTEIDRLMKDIRWCEEHQPELLRRVKQFKTLYISAKNKLWHYQNMDFISRLLFLFFPGSMRK